MSREAFSWDEIGVSELIEQVDSIDRQWCSSEGVRPEQALEGLELIKRTVEAMAAVLRRRLS